MGRWVGGWVGGRTDRVGAGQVDAQPARAGGEEEDGKGRIRGVELIDEGLSFADWGGAVQAEERDGESSFEEST